MRPGGVPRAARSDSAGSLGIPAAWVVPAMAGSSLAAARELPEGRGRVGSVTRGVGDMLPEDRLACIVPTDGTLGSETPALLWSTTTPLRSFNRSGTATARAGPPFRVSLVPGKVEHGGDPGRAAGKEASAGFGWPRWFDRHSAR